MNDTEKGERKEEDFRELLEQSLAEGQRRFRPGEKHAVQIVKISPEWVFVDLGGKTEGIIDRSEFVGEDGSIGIREGDTVEAYFLSSARNEKKFTTRIGKTAAGKAHLEEAWRSRIPVEGLVEEEVKGGFSVRIAGTFRAFCPFSQMSLERIGDPASVVGEKHLFLLSEFDGKGRNIVVTRRPLLEAERKEKKEKVMNALEEGMTVRGRIVSFQKYGAFVDLGGVEGLLPISEISWGHVEDIRDVLTAGQELELQVLKLDREKDRLSLSLRKIQPDPWLTVEQRYTEGSSCRGKVVRLARFGAFVELEPGIEGLLHISRLGEGKKIKHPGDVLSKGQILDLRIERLDRDGRQISLVPAGEGLSGESDGSDYVSPASVQGGSLGTLGDLLQRKLRAPGKSRK
ncbi:MAG TPA: S1 RNA-binding domain-containing protein [Syntrophales bacterium]|nr:S1 RNA-binding domain-containing protein [Syntrophales bacterium]